MKKLYILILLFIFLSVSITVYAFQFIGGQPVASGGTGGPPFTVYGLHNPQGTYPDRIASSLL